MKKKDLFMVNGDLANLFERPLAYGLSWQH